MTTPLQQQLTSALAAAIGAAGGQDGNNGFAKSVFQLSGQIISWNENTNQNLVQVNGTVLQNLLVLQQGSNVQYFPGDTVFLLKMDDSYVIMGKLGLPGQNATSQIQTATAGGVVILGPTAGVWTAFADNGPALSVQVGASCKVAVTWSADVSSNQSDIEIGWKISGASNVAPGPFQGTTVHKGGQGGAAPPPTEGDNLMGFYTLQSNGINPGQNNFQMMYRVTVTGTGTGVAVGTRLLAVEPK